MQKGRVWDSCFPRVCCGEDDQGIDLISPPCPYALIAPQQTSFVRKLPAAGCSGIRHGSWFVEVVGRMVKSQVALSGLTLLPTQRGDLLKMGAALVLTPFPFQIRYFTSVTVSFSAIYWALKPWFSQQIQPFCCLRQTGKTSLSDLCEFVSVFVP